MAESPTPGALRILASGATVVAVRLAPPPVSLGTVALIALACAVFASPAAGSGGQNPGPNSPNPLVGQLW